MLIKIPAAHREVIVAKPNQFMIHAIQTFCSELALEFTSIPEERKEALEKIAGYISEKLHKGMPVQLMYVCTHNSRRSHFGQIWAQVAAAYFHVKGIHTFSGGTEVTAFHPNAIRALQRIGFDIRRVSGEINPVYEVYYDLNEEPLTCFSKTYDDSFNPNTHVAAIMTCGDAEKNCPFIPGVELRIATPYKDPKESDHSPQQDDMYHSCSRLIALESLYVFSKVNFKNDEKVFS
ncbi:MAG: protein-tyrosine-phosphatase [Bacteroidota bacterium]|nr:protein-tyrosine-phosphatase [Bacteroidota bacterium]